MWDADYRQEQMFARDYIAEIHPDWELCLEKPIYDLELDEKPYRNCVLDIAVMNKSIAIRLNGEYHFTSSKQGLKDEFQKEALQQAGWKVVDFNFFNMPNLFKKKKKEETVKLAKEEIVKYLG